MVNFLEFIDLIFDDIIISCLVDLLLKIILIVIDDIDLFFFKEIIFMDSFDSFVINICIGGVIVCIWIVIDMDGMMIFVF